MTKDEALRIALEALQAIQPECDDFHHKKKEMHDWSEICRPLERYNQAITTIKEALEQPEKDIPKIGCVNHDCDKCKAQPENDCTRSHPHEEMSKECELRTEIARLTNCLARANSQAEHFEREWYLRGDEIERLTEQPKEPEQEPVFWWNGGTQFATQKSKEWDRRTGGTTAFGCDIPLYTIPPQRTWVGLTDEEVNELVEHTECEDYYGLVEATEAKLKEKNT